MPFNRLKQKIGLRRPHSRKQQKGNDASTTADDQINSDVPANPKRPSACVGDQLLQTDSLGESSMPLSPPSKAPERSIRQLWDQAYEKLQKEDKELIAKYESKVSGDLGTSLSSMLGPKANMRDQMQAVLQRKMNEIDRNKWKLKVGSSEVHTQDLLQPVLSTVTWANNFIGQAVSANPYASLAWAGVGLLLPIFLNPSEQRAWLATGLEYISSLIAQSQIWEDHYAQRYESGTSRHESSSPSGTIYKNALEELYREILRFQATSYCYYTQNTVRRVGQDTVKWHDWDGMLEGIKNKKSKFDEVINSWRDIKDAEESLATDKRHQEALHFWRDLSDQLSQLQEAVKAAQAAEEKKRKALLDWLCSVDPSDIYNTSRDKHENGTCDWLVRDTGSGKSILSSSVIKYLRDRCASDPKTAFAYFFFSFSDKNKQSLAVMLSSLIKQLYADQPTIPLLTERLDKYMQKGQRPDTRTLEDALIDTLSAFSSVFVVIDALDECPILNRERSNLLGSLRRIITTMPDNLHVFCTSRAEPDVSAVLSAILSPPSKTAINLTTNQAGTNRDIIMYIDSVLASHDYSSWPEYLKAKAKDLLIGKADGMFQYVSCQFDAIRNLRSELRINDALEKLPNGLDATYDRLLQSIDETFQAQVIGLLKWLAFSNKPLTLRELADIFILRPENNVAFDVAERIFQPEDCLEYMPGLVITYEHLGYIKCVRLAHFSIKEYLISNRIANGPTRVFWFTEEDAHLHIAYSCLAYHLHRIATSVREDYRYTGLREYAARNWMIHFEMIPREKWQVEVTRLAARALAARSKSMSGILRRNKIIRRRSHNWLEPCEYLLRPQCYTARLGFLELTKMLLFDDPITNKYSTQTDSDIALQQAAYGGNIAVVKLLHDEGARINAENGELGSPLRAAASEGHETIVTFLLDNGANVNTQHTTLGSALHAAAASGHLHILRLLVCRGADINLPPGEAGCILESAARNHGTECLRYLLDHGADINSQGGREGVALHKAAQKSESNCFKLLLERGADVNAQGGEYGYPLQAASMALNQDKVKLLLERGANINAQGGKYGNALQAACQSHSSKDGIEGGVVELLLDQGADINMQGGAFGTALQAACLRVEYNLELVKFLLENGADVNIQGGLYGNALQAACYAGSLECAHLLLEHGANISAQGGQYGNALQAACSENQLEIARLLLDKGADVNAPGGEYGGALHAAAASINIGISKRETDLLELLLSKGAHINQLGGDLGTALQYACYKSNLNSMSALIERGADLHIQAGKFGSAWHTAAASDICRNDTLQLLLDHGADINDARGRKYATALQAAIEGCHEVDKIRFLLDHGADINVTAGTYGFLLQSACAMDGQQSRRYRPVRCQEVVEFLLQNYPDIDINGEGGLFGSALQAAAYSGQTDSVKLLLEGGARTDTRGGKYGSALNAAVLKGFWDIVEILLDHGAKSDRQQGLKPEEEWLACVREADGGEALERYWKFWEKQVISEDVSDRSQSRQGGQGKQGRQKGQKEQKKQRRQGRQRQDYASAEEGTV
ncbi:ankyrin repeat-containing domain protein [Nemania sp. NC0429]|nr:ankyrin repeat-containing domain protein [Nemania sp. NC0429]